MVKINASKNVHVFNRLSFFSTGPTSAGAFRHHGCEGLQEKNPSFYVIIHALVYSDTACRFEMGIECAGNIKNSFVPVLKIFLR
jgi:hypothetical protein